MTIQQFASETVGAGAREFQAWYDANPGGFYINMKNPQQGMLHAVGCPHLGNPREWTAGPFDSCRRRKVCDLDRRALVRWAQELRVTLTPCSDCRP